MQLENILQLIDSEIIRLNASLSYEKIMREKAEKEQKHTQDLLDNTLAKYNEFLQKTGGVVNV